MGGEGWWALTGEFGERGESCGWSRVMGRHGRLHLGVATEHCCTREGRREGGREERREGREGGKERERERERVGKRGRQK